MYAGTLAARQRGYTGHEHLPSLGVIHMNGRVYDPEIGRFLSPDTFVQFPESTQGFNRYTYVGNNPLSASDPSGHFIMLAASIALTAAEAHIVTSIAVMAVAGYLETGSIKGGLLAAASAGVSFGIGEAFKLAPGASLSTTQLIQKAVLHGLTQGALSAAGGGRFGDGFLGGLAGGLTEGIKLPKGPAGVAMAAVIGGTVSKIGGGRFANGATSAAFVHVFNFLNHQQLKAAFDAAPPTPVSAVADGATVVITYSDGSVEVRSGGTRAWRNNNPGNITAGKFANKHGAIGSAGGFAVFPGEQVGADAQVSLLRTSKYSSLSIDGVVERYAPPSENPTATYQKYVAGQVGVPGSTQISTLNNAQMNSLTMAMRRFEGWAPGDITWRKP
jgi:RHS repeat-associated protein